MRAKDSMTKQVIFMSPSEKLQSAYDVMQKMSFRHIPVIETGRLVGILSDRDILLVSSVDGLGCVQVPDMKIREIMTTSPITCHESTRIREIAEMMLTSKIDCVPVVNNHNRLVGLVTSSDLLAILRDDPNSLSLDQVPIRYSVEEFRSPRDA